MMATYTEIRNLFNDSVLRNRVTVAIIIAAETVRTEASATTGHALRAAWARQAFENPQHEADKALKSVLAANRTATVAAIMAATDATVQAQVDAVVDILAGV